MHRFEGHAVRLNVADAHGEPLRQARADNPWAVMFAAARRVTDQGSEIVPCWIYEGPV